MSNSCVKRSITSTSVIGVRTRFTPRWSAYLGFACALLLLLSGRHTDWIFHGFPGMGAFDEYLYSLKISGALLKVGHERRSDAQTIGGPVGHF
jgi:hypothetical protein